MAESAEIGLGACELFGIAPEERNFTSARANPSRDLEAQTARAAGDESNFIFKESRSCH